MEQLTQELNAIPRSALNQQAEEQEKSPLAHTLCSSTDTGELLQHDFSSIPFSTARLSSTLLLLGSQLLPKAEVMLEMLTLKEQLGPFLLLCGLCICVCKTYMGAYSRINS